MTRSMAHRGPDSEGYHVEGALGLGHRRLSIIDLSQGHQPLSNETGDVWIVFNGEIYNYPELRNFLVQRNHAFRTQSDTEVIVHLYEEKGTDCLSFLDGMFGFAIWDARKSQLFIARDRLGKKPVYYYAGTRFFSFGSELKALVVDAEIPRDIDSQGLFHYLRYGYVPTPCSIYRGIQKLEPGHYLLVDAQGKMTSAPYWQLRFTEDLPLDEKQISEEVRGLIYQAVEKRLISEVPLGAFLSGGIDSSLVVGIMASLLERPVKTFTIGYQEAAYDETRDAEIIASRFHTDHHTDFVKADTIEDLLPRLVSQFDEPFSDASAIPTYYVSRFARQHVTVALSGDGGDEVFAGYLRYLDDRRDAFFTSLPTAVRRDLIGGLAQVLPEGARGKRYFAYIAQEAIGRYRTKIGVFPDWELCHLLTPEFQFQLDSNGPTDPLEMAYRSQDSASTLSRMQYSDIKTYLLDDILVKVDRMSMLNSLEVRAPLLDYRLVEYAARIPSEFHRRDGRGKYLLRRAFSDLLPERTIDKAKQGFGVPLEFWFRGSLSSFARESLLGSALDGLEMIEPRAVAKLLDDHQSGRRDNSPLLWNLLNLVYWKKMAMVPSKLMLA